LLYVYTTAPKETLGVNAASPRLWRGLAGERKKKEREKREKKSFSKGGILATNKTTLQNHHPFALLPLFYFLFF